MSTEVEMDYTYEFECDHGDGQVAMLKCKKEPPQFYEFICPFGGGELVRGRRRAGGAILTRFEKCNDCGSDVLVRLDHEGPVRHSDHN